MNTNDRPAVGASEATRRSFLLAGTAAMALGASPPANAANPEEPGRPADEAPAEWRNKQAGMAYRRLGRTGLMISEVVCGGDPITLRELQAPGAALEMGLNYLDMAPAYNGGDTERAYGKLLGGLLEQRRRSSSPPRSATSTSVRSRMYKELFDGLPATKQEAIRRRAQEISAATAREAGLLPDILPGPARGPSTRPISAWRCMPEFGERVEGSRGAPRSMVESLEGSLKRVGTDHFDIVMCPARSRPGRGPHSRDRRGLPAVEAAGQGAVPGRDLAQRPGRRAPRGGRGGPLRRGDDGLQRHQRRLRERGAGSARRPRRAWASSP